MKLILIQDMVDDKNSTGNPQNFSGHRVGLFVDNETGVEYFVMNSSNAGAICPRLNSDGKPYIFKK